MIRNLIQKLMWLSVMIVSMPSSVSWATPGDFCEEAGGIKNSKNQCVCRLDKDTKLHPRKVVLEKKGKIRGKGGCCSERFYDDLTQACCGRNIFNPKTSSCDGGVVVTLGAGRKASPAGSSSGAHSSD